MKIKKCPFCGGTSELIVESGIKWVKCNVCDAEGPTKNTIEIWNKVSDAVYGNEDS